MVTMHIMAKNNYDLGLYEKALPNHLTWEEKLRLTKSLGFDFIEISVDETDEKLARLDDHDFQKHLKKLIEEYGVTIRSMCLSGHRKYPLGSKDALIRKRSLEIFVKAVDMAEYLGIRIIQLAGYDVYYETSDQETEMYFRENLVKGIEYAAQKGILCAFESMETEFMNTMTKIMEYVDFVDSPYCQIYPDLGNLMNASLKHGDMYQDLTVAKGHIVAAHLKETVPNVFREVEFGTGHVDFEKGISHLLNLGVRSFVCECWYLEGQDYETVLKDNNKFLRHYFERMGYLEN